MEAGSGPYTPGMHRKLNEAECRAAMTAKDFGPDITGAAPSVAIILTQSWCPQWVWMKTWLQGASAGDDRAVFTVEYDRESFYEDFMQFKESTFHNYEIPYVRYYRDGKLVRESNYIDRSGFLRLLGLS